MLLKLAEHISNCLERAASAEQRAQQATDSATRSENELLAQSWRHLARSYQFVESLDHFLSDTALRKEAMVELEMLTTVVEQPAQPQSKPIIRRRRVKHETTFKERLLNSAQEAREQAAQLPAGLARDRLLLKARQSETAAGIENWVSSPGSAPPDNFDFTKKPKG